MIRRALEIHEMWESSERCIDQLSERLAAGRTMGNTPSLRAAAGMLYSFHLLCNAEQFARATGSLAMSVGDYQGTKVPHLWFLNGPTGDDQQEMRYAIDRIRDFLNHLRVDLIHRDMFIMSADGSGCYTARPMYLDVFPSAEYDVREALKCYSFDLFSASAFHCLKAAEIASVILMLALDPKLNPTSDPMFKDWGSLNAYMEELANTKLTVGKPHGPQKNRACQFLKETISEMKVLKGTRDTLMHNNGTMYTCVTSQDLRRRVDKLFCTIATRTHENGPELSFASFA